MAGEDENNAEADEDLAGEDKYYISVVYSLYRSHINFTRPSYAIILRLQPQSCHHPPVAAVIPPSPQSRRYVISLEKRR